jgi:hypothetical protein
VAEQKAKGGSWKDDMSKARIDYIVEDMASVTASSTIGFRPAIEIK